MRKRRKTLVFVLCVSALLTLLLTAARDNQPTYQGHTLEYWLEICAADAAADAGVTAEQVRQAEEAVRHIGTKALPCSVKWIQYESPGWQYQLAGVMWKLWLPASVKERLRSTIFNDTKRKRIGLGFRSFKILGEKGAPAIPDLVRLLYSPKSERVHGPPMHCVPSAASAFPCFLMLSLTPISRTATQ